MLTPPQAISAGDADLDPTRATGFPIKVVPGQRMSQLLSILGTIPFAELRLYSFQDGELERTHTVQKLTNDQQQQALQAERLGISNLQLSTTRKQPASDLKLKRLGVRAGKWADA